MIFTDPMPPLQQLLLGVFLGMLSTLPVVMCLTVKSATMKLPPWRPKPPTNLCSTTSGN
jgi:hypothetical protein